MPRNIVTYCLSTMFNVVKLVLKLSRCMVLLAICLGQWSVTSPRLDHADTLHASASPILCRQPHYMCLFRTVSTNLPHLFVSIYCLANCIDCDAGLVLVLLCIPTTEDPSTPRVAELSCKGLKAFTAYKILLNLSS